VSWGDLLTVFLRAAFLSVNGSTTIALLKEDLVDRLRVLNEAQFATGFVIGSVSPGPYGFGAIAMGFLADGWRGALVATFTSWLPSFLVIPLRAGYQRLEGKPWMAGMTWGVAGAGAGLLIALTVGLARTTIMSFREATVTAIVLALLAARVPIAGAIAAGALLGAIFLR
jgi:chromate transporter